MSYTLEFPDGDALARGLLSAGGLAEVIGPAREGEAGAALIAGMAPYRAADGGYRLENEWHYLLASA